MKEKNKEGTLPMEGLQIIPMTPQNVERIYEAELLSFDIPWSKESFCDEVKNPRATYLAIENQQGEILAYGGFWKILDEAHITNIAVIPQHRGMGLGNMIVEALLEIALSQDISELTLEVRSSNVTAQNLYGKYGFKIGGIRKEYYTDNREDAIIMWKSL